MTPVEIGLSASLIIVIALIVRLIISPGMRDEIKRRRTVAELEHEITTLRGTVETMSEQNMTLRNRLQQCELDRQNQEVTLAALRGEMGRTTK